MRPEKPRLTARSIALLALCSAMVYALQVALAAILTEVDQNGMEHQRGMKAMTIPAHDSPTCRDVLVKCVKFVLPEDLSVSGGSMCSPRKLKARFLANNIDTDYRCCESVFTL